MHGIRLTMLCLPFVCSTIADGQQDDSQEHVVCPAVQLLLEASASDFSSIKLKEKRRFLGGSDWVPSIFIGDSVDCDGQTDRDKTSAVSCRMIEASTVDEAKIWYSSIVRELESCLDARFIFKERQGGKAMLLMTPIKQASFKVYGRGVSPDGPAVRVRLDNFHGKNGSGFDVTIWIDSADKD